VWIVIASRGELEHAHSAASSSVTDQQFRTMRRSLSASRVSAWSKWQTAERRRRLAENGRATWIVDGSVNGHLTEALTKRVGASYKRTAVGSAAASAVQATSLLRRLRGYRAAVAARSVEERALEKALHPSRVKTRDRRRKEQKKVTITLFYC